MEEEFKYEGLTTGFHPSSTEYAKDVLSLDKLLDLKNPSVFMFRASGGAGKQFHIRDGDIVVVNRDTSPIVGCAYIFHINETFHMGWYRILKGRPVIMPQMIYLDGEMDFETRVWGAIVCILHFYSQPKLD